MTTLHIGRGQTHGAVTVFPLWDADARWSRCTADPRHLDVTECADGPAVSRLMVGNVGDRPVLVLEGQLFEGGWQHRMVRRSVLVGVHQRMSLEVACVEQGRWGGSPAQHTRGRRATPYVRDAVRAGGDVQGEVWRRVARHAVGTENATASLVAHLDARPEAPTVQPLAGQVGVLVGIGGQPCVAEVFDSPLVLRQQLSSIVAAAMADAKFAPVVATPGRRARRFVERFEMIGLHASGPAGVAQRVTGRSEHVDAEALRWKGRQPHLRLSNVRHPLLVGA